MRKRDTESKKIEQLYEKYKYLLYREANGILNNCNLAEEVVQQTFVKVVENIKNIDNVEANKTKNFLCVICRNIALNIYNKKRKEKFVYIDDHLFNETNFTNEENKLRINDEIIIYIRLAIKELPQELRDIIILEKYYGYKKEEIAKLFDISVDVIYKRSKKAKDLLFKYVSERSKEKDGRK